MDMWDKEIYDRYLKWDDFTAYKARDGVIPSD